jgi:ABC-type transport system substrate-binding protein
LKIVSIFLIIVSVHIFAEGAEMKEYVISESSRYTSLDPLDADLHQNLSVARMVYATPLEIDATDTITSLVLDSFNYNKTTKTITWQVRPGLQFSDGKPLTVDDVVFSVTRMLHANPKFPVTKTYAIKKSSKWNYGRWQ